jgi:cholest-4-en-3-one 26-monooxygenase
MKSSLAELLQRTTDIQPAGNIVFARDSFSGGVSELPVTLTAA